VLFKSRAASPGYSRTRRIDFYLARTERKNSYIYIYMGMYVCICVYRYVCIYVCMCVYVCRLCIQGHFTEGGRAVTP